MLFTQIEFFIFFILLLVILKIVKERKYQKIIILIANSYFYAYWDYRFLILLFFSTCSDFILAKSIDIVQHVFQKRIFLYLSLAINLTILVFFKYFNFFLTTFKKLPFIQNLNLHTINVILPLGISFYTFRLISYVVDVYQGKIKSCQKFIDFAIYTTFFPIIVSGPISRASSFLPQLETFSISKNNLFAGYRLFVIGLFLKIFIADRLAMFVNHFYNNYNIFDTTTTWLAVSAYTMQIYSDFAGYSSMAIGTALMLGFNIEENFNFPYLATSISEFWRRWHITLSYWIRDYIYIPLGGSRKGKYRTYINLMIAMTLCGLWHGAAWTFVAWGFFHGVALVINHVWKNSLSNKCRKYSIFTIIIFWFLTFISVSVGWILFRSNTFSQAMAIIYKLTSFHNGITWYQPFVIFVLISTIIVHILKIFNVKFIQLPLEAKYTLTILFCLIWLVIVFYPKKFQPFVYLEF